MKKRGRKRTALALVSATALAATGVGWLTSEPPEPAHAARSPPAPEPAERAAATVAIPELAASGSVWQAGASPMAQAGKAAEVDRLIATGRPRDAFSAYEFAFQCLSARFNESLGPRPTPGGEAARQAGSKASDICGDISPGQLASRRQWLDKAAEAGIRGSLDKLGLEGTKGLELEMASMQLDSPPDPTPDELVAIEQLTERIASLAKRAAPTGDPRALLSLEHYYRNSGDLVMSLATMVAANDALRVETGKGWRPFEILRAQVRERLSPADYQRGLAEGAALIQQAGEFRSREGLE